MNVFKSTFAVVGVALVLAMPAFARISPHETINCWLGARGKGDLVTITYGRPYTKDPKTGEPRQIWGGLVAWDKPDRLGADEATLFLTEKPVLVGRTPIPAGAYTLYIVPSESGATKLAFSSHLGKWGIPVDDKHDVARVDLKKEPLEKSVDQLTIELKPDPKTNSAVLQISWEKTQFSVPLTYVQS